MSAPTIPAPADAADRRATEVSGLVGGTDREFVSLVSLEEYVASVLAADAARWAESEAA